MQRRLKIISSCRYGRQGGPATGVQSSAIKKKLWANRVTAVLSKYLVAWCGMSLRMYKKAVITTMRTHGGVIKQAGILTLIYSLPHTQSKSIKSGSSLSAAIFENNYCHFLRTLLVGLLKSWFLHISPPFNTKWHVSSIASYVCDARPATYDPFCLCTTNSWNQAHNELRTCFHKTIWISRLKTTTQLSRTTASFLSFEKSVDVNHSLLKS